MVTTLRHAWGKPKKIVRFEIEHSYAVVSISMFL